METSEVPLETESTASFARKLVLELQQAILQYEPQAKNGDIEAVHDMRVGLRRLRVAIKNFAVCFSKEDRQQWRNRMETLADALGAVRDLDVMVAALISQQASSSALSAEEQAAFTTFVHRLQIRRRRKLRELRAYLRSEEYAEFKRQFSFGEAATMAKRKEVRREQTI